MPDLAPEVLFSHDALIELGVVMAYVACFGITVYGWRTPEAYAFAPELSTVSAVLYGKSIFQLTDGILLLLRADFTSERIHGFFRLAEMLILVFVLPSVMFILVVDLVKGYIAELGNTDIATPDLDTVTLIWRANFFGFLVCLVTNLVTTYINQAATAYIGHPA